MVDVATTAMRLAEMAAWMGTPRKSVSAGMMNTPPPRPTIDPKVAADEADDAEKDNVRHDDEAITGPRSSRAAPDFSTL